MNYSWRIKQIIPAEPGHRAVVLWPADDPDGTAEVFPIIGWALREQIETGGEFGDDERPVTPTEETDVEALLLGLDEERPHQASTLSGWLTQNCTESHPHAVYRVLRPGDELTDDDRTAIIRRQIVLAWEWRRMTALEEMRRAAFPGVPTDDLWKIRDSEPEKVRLRDDLYERMRQWERDNPKPDPRGVDVRPSAP